MPEHPSPSACRPTFAGELRHLRGQLSYRELALRSQVSKTHIYDLENGRRTATTPIATALDTALGARGRLVELAAAELRTAPRPRHAAGKGDEVRRRDFLKSVSAAAGITVLGLDPGDDLSGRELLAAHTDLRAVHGRLDNLCGAGYVYSQAIEHHHRVLDLLTATHSPADRRLVAALAADTGGFLGFLTWDQGHSENAATHYRAAIDHADQADDISCAANLIGQLSRVLGDRGHHRKALEVANRALARAGTRAHPAVRSWLHAVRSRHHANLGNERAAHNDLASAWKLLDHADDGHKPLYISYLGPAELGKWNGHTLVSLAAHHTQYARAAVTALDEARNLWPGPMVRGSAEMLTASARAYELAGHRDAATQLVQRAVDIATATGSARNLRAALDVQTITGQPPHKPETTKPR